MTRVRNETITERERSAGLVHTKSTTGSSGLFILIEAPGVWVVQCKVGLSQGKGGEDDKNGVQHNDDRRGYIYARTWTFICVSSSQRLADKKIF